MKKKVILLLALLVIFIGEVYYSFASGYFKITKNTTESSRSSIASRDEENKILELTRTNKPETDFKTGATSISIKEGSLFIGPVEMNMHDRKVYFINQSDNKTILIPINKPVASQFTPAISNQCKLPWGKTPGR